MANLNRTSGKDNNLTRDHFHKYSHKSSSGVQEFGSGLRKIFWPIKSNELGKFIPMSALMFFILFNQNVLRILKDSILISEVSAEITSFTKVYCVTPLSTIFVIIYAKLINHLSFNKIFNVLSGFFIIFYLIFAFVLYPNVAVFHIDQGQLEYLMKVSPHLKWYISLIGNWSYVLFYSLSELWPNIFYVLLFWQFANEITTTNEAKRFYTLFSLLGNSSLIVVGLLMMNLSSPSGNLGHYLYAKGYQGDYSSEESKIILTQISILLFTITSILSCFFVCYITKKIIGSDPLIRYDKKSDRKEADIREANTKPENKMGVLTSFRYIARSKYLWLMLVCSASFGLSMNLVEAVWKSKIKELYPGVNQFAEFNSLYILWTGVAIMIMTIIGNNIMRKYNWFTSAVISPIIILVTGTIFFFLVVFDHYIISLFQGTILLSPLTLAVFIGAIQNILSKGSKYSIWDTSLQMLYIPLDKELRTKGKAAVDVISPKIGKSASGLVQSVIFTIIPLATYNSIAMGLMIIFISVCILWIYSVHKIYLEYQKIIS